MIDYLKTPAIIFILFALVVNIILSLKTIKKITTIITLIITALIPVCLVVLKLLEVALPKVGSLDFEWLCAIASGAIVILNAILLLIGDKNVELFKEVPSSLEHKIMGYLNGEGTLIKFTPYFFDELGIDSKESKKWYEHVNKIFYNSLEVSYQELLDALETNDGSEAKISVLLKNDDELDEEVTFDFVKVNIDKDDDTIGYVLVAKGEQEKNMIDGFGYLLDNIDSPFAYYNDNSRNVVFRTNKSFKALLGVRGYNVTYSELRRLVYPEDLSVFDRASSELSDDDTYVYRMKTSLGLKKFKEIKAVKESHVISIIQMINDSSDKLLDKKIVFEKVDKLISDNKPFGGMMISLNSFVDLFNTRGPIMAKELANRFTEYLQNEILGKEDLICKISDIEYLLLFTDVDKLDSLVRDIQNGVSTIVHYEFNCGTETINAINSVGIVYKNENISNSNDFVNALDNSLAEANKDGKEDGVSLYVAEEKKKESSKLTKENYSFDKVKISLDNSFLDDDEI